MLRFSDGVSIDTNGPYRTLQLSDGWYLVGNGVLLPARDEAEAKQLLSNMVRNDLAFRRIDSSVWD